MIEERRRHPRIPMTVNVVVSAGDGEPVTLTTNDISGGGAFLRWEEGQKPDLRGLLELESDDELMLQVFGLLGDGDAPPKVRAQVVRVHEDGIAVRFDPEAMGG
ncbi:PilZ domain-containing protein [Thioalkalivibrio sp. ALE20]|uniref:PilZ domain-containing protein n=1 Tax=Thioalkalivibrio sp. ALE20 TaxID=545275 RepID=UPI00036A8D50|nr:PilZ domain-containing protein [Thioalkalivibrio sp. ALE20]